jgi:hypothetical protein
MEHLIHGVHQLVEFQDLAQEDGLVVVEVVELILPEVLRRNLVAMVAVVLVVLLVVLVVLTLEVVEVEDPIQDRDPQVVPVALDLLLSVT